MFVIGLTGSIGSGKTEAANALASKGAQIIDADREAHDLYPPGSDVLKSLVKIAGEEILSKDGSINRSLLGKALIENSDVMEQINSVLHPLIREKIQHKINVLSDSHAGTLVIQVPLLFQAKWEDLFDEIWAIETPENLTVERLIRNRGFDVQKAENWIKVQGNAKTFTEKADVIIENKGSLSEFKASIDKTWVQRRLHRGQNDK